MTSPSQFIGFSQVIEPEEPSAVDYLAAIADPDGEAAQRVSLWNNRPVEPPSCTVTFIDDSDWELPPGLTATITVAEPRTLRRPKRTRRVRRKRRRRR
jgi:hypothetical protein